MKFFAPIYEKKETAEEQVRSMAKPLTVSVCFRQNIVFPDLDLDFVI